MLKTEKYQLFYNNQIGKYMSSLQDSAEKRKYSQISIKKRQKLVELVIQKDYIIAKAARRLGIKSSTARMIINKYRVTGTFPMKKFRRQIGSEHILNDKIQEQPVSKFQEHLAQNLQAETVYNKQNQQGENPFNLKYIQTSPYYFGCWPTPLCYIPYNFSF